MSVADDTNSISGVGLTSAQERQLLAGIDTGRVQHLRGMSHLEAWDVRRWLIRIFGFTGWSFEVLDTAMVHETLNPVGGKTRCTVVYRVTGRLVVKDAAGNVIGSWDDGACGDAQNQPSVGDAHDLALKTAMSQALKRCAVNLGDQFGLSLYNNGSTGSVVIRTVAMIDAEMPADPPVGAPLPADPPVKVPSQDVPERVAVRSAGGGDDEWNTPPEPAVTALLLNEIALALKVVRGLTEADLMLAAVADLVKRDIADVQQLTAAEARTVLVKLRIEYDARLVEKEIAAKRR